MCIKSKWLTRQSSELLILVRSDPNYVRYENFIFLLLKEVKFNEKLSETHPKPSTTIL